MTKNTATFPGRFESLQKISKFVVQAAKKAGLNEDAVYGVELAVDEACSNIIEHAYKGEDRGEIECTCEITPKGIRIVISDSGQPFDPNQIPKPDIISPVEERKTGGLGLFYIEQMMDEAHYEFEKNKNTLTMVKNK